MANRDNVCRNNGWSYISGAPRFAPPVDGSSQRGTETEGSRVTAQAPHAQGGHYPETLVKDSSGIQHKYTQTRRPALTARATDARYASSTPIQRCVGRGTHVRFWSSGGCLAIVDFRTFGGCTPD